MVRRALVVSLSRTLWAGLGSHLRYQFVVGLLLLVPLLLTYLVLRFIFDFLDGVLGPMLDTLLNREIPGLGIIVLIMLVYLSGVVVTVVIGRQIFLGMEQVLLSVPGVRQVYAASRQLVTSMGGKTATGLSRVVLIEYPRSGLWAMGFLSCLTTGENGHSIATVYIPTAPLPNSGWVAVLPTSDVYETTLSFNELMQYVFSGGMIFPHRLEKWPLPELSTESPLVLTL